MATFPHVFQPKFDEVFQKDFELKGKWNDYFKNDNPIVLELGCGKGEYTTRLGQEFPGKNFIGIDLKGVRLWRGAKNASHNGLATLALARAKLQI